MTDTIATEVQTFTVDLAALAETAKAELERAEKIARLRGAAGGLAEALGLPSVEAIAQRSASIFAAWATVTGQTATEIEAAAAAADYDNPVDYILTQMDAVIGGTAKVVLKG